MLPMMWYDVTVAQDNVCCPGCGMMSMLHWIMCVKHEEVIISLLLKMLCVDYDVAITSRVGTC